MNGDSWQKRLTGVRAAVWGDLCLDRYRYGEVRVLAREAPVAALHLQREVLSGGQAANVALNLAALGAEVTSIGVVGDDAEGKLLCEILGGRGVKLDGVITAKRPTELREKMVSLSSHQPRQHLLHVYRELTTQLTPAVSNKLWAKLDEIVPRADVLLLVDYGNGMCLGRLPTMILSHVKKSGIKTVANTRRSPSHFPGAGGMIVNLRQARSYGSPQNLMLRLGLEWLIISEGVRGMTLYNSNESLHVDPPGKKAVVDITGAGDTMLAWITAGWAAGLEWAETMNLANYAAQVAVAVEGTAAPTVEEVAAIL